MKIVMVAPTVGDAFGQEQAITLTTQTLRDQGHSVHWIAQSAKGRLPQGQSVDWIRDLSAWHMLSPTRKITPQVNTLKEIIHRIKPDCIHLHDPLDHRIVVALAQLAPILLTAHTVSPTCPQSARLCALPSKLPTGGCERPSGWGCMLAHYSQGCLSFLKSPLHRAHAIGTHNWRKQALQRGVRRVIAPSQYIAQMLKLDGWSAEKISVVPNAVRIDTAHTAFPKPETPALIFAGRLTALKGLVDLLHALVPLQSQAWALWVCGEGPEEPLARSLALSQLAGRVEFLGRIERSELHARMRVASAVVAPNRGPEAFGLTAAEAAVLGIPLISTRVGGLIEIAALQATGGTPPLTCRPGDVPALIECLRQLLADPESHRRRAEATAPKVAQHLSLDTHRAAMERVYTQI